MDVALAELILEHAVHALRALALELVVHGDHVAVELLHILPQLKEVVHAADCHTAHGGPHVVLRHILERVLVAVGADGHVEHERVHVDDDVEPPAVVRPGTPVGVIQRRARPRDHAVAGFGEGHGLVPHAALHDPADAGIDLMPDEVFPVLRLIDAVERLRNAVDGIVVGVRGNIPFLPLEPLQLVLNFQIFDELIPVERHGGHFLNEFPRALDLLGAVLLDERIVKLHRLRHGVKRLIEEPVLQSGACNGSVARFVGRDEHRGVIRHIVLHKDTGFRLAHRARDRWTARRRYSGERCGC